MYIFGPEMQKASSRSLSISLPNEPYKTPVVTSEVKDSVNITANRGKPGPSKHQMGLSITSTRQQPKSKDANNARKRA